MNTETPLIWTTKGNLPVADLEYKTAWIDHEDYLSFSEQYFLGDELVKSNAHIYSKKPLEFFGVQNPLT